MRKLVRNLFRIDTGADSDFSRRIQAAAAEAERHLNGASSESEAARLRMPDRMGLLAANSSADAARRRMIQRHQQRREQ